VLSKIGLSVRVIRAGVVLGIVDKVVPVPVTGVLLEVVKFWLVAAPAVGVEPEVGADMVFLRTSRAGGRWVKQRRAAAQFQRAVARPGPITY